METIDSTISQYIEFSTEKNSKDKSKALKRAVNFLKSREGDLLEIVTALGPFLTNSKETVRCAASQFLSSIIIKTPTRKLDTNQFDTLWDFYVSRLQDHPCAEEILQGLVALLHRSSSLSFERATSLICGIFDHVNTQALRQAARASVYDILMQLATKYTHHIKSMNQDFALGLLNAVDGEKDPRNLLLTFRLVGFIYSSCLSSEIAAETITEMFEIISCYFPINFRPPPGDVFQITKEDLGQALEQALTSHSSVVPHLVPLLLDRMYAAPGEDATIQSLSMTRACVKSFGIHSLLPYIPELLDVCRDNLEHSSNETAREAGLLTLDVLVESLHKATEQREWEQHVEPIVNRCRSELKEPTEDSKELVDRISLIESQFKALSHLASLSEQLFRWTWSHVWTVLEMRLNDTHTVPSLKRLSMELLAGLTESTHAQLDSSQIMSIYEIAQFYTMSETNQTKLTAFTVLCNLCTLEDVSTSLKRSVLQDISQCIVESSIEKSLRTSLTLLLRKCCRFAFLHTLLEEVILDQVFEYNTLLQQLVIDLAQETPFQCRILEKLSTRETDEITQTLVKVLRQCTTLGSAESMLEEAAWKRYYHLTSHNKSIGLDLIREIVRCSRTPEKYFERAEQCLLSESNDVDICLAVFGGSCVSISLNRADQVAQALLRKSLSSVSLVLAVLLNRLESNDARVEVFEAMMTQCKQAKQPQTHRLILMLHALIRRPSDPTVAQMIQRVTDRLMAVFETDWATEEFAINFSNLFADDKIEFTVRYGATISPLYKQRAFYRLFPQLGQMYARVLQEKQPTQEYCLLIALVGLLKDLPKQILKDYFIEIIPFLVQALKMERQIPLLVTQVILVFRQLLDQDPSLLANYLEMILEPLLSLLAHESSVFRLASLQCLRHLAKLGYVKLFPFRHQVLKALHRVLDDRKRVIRQYAATCRNEWYLMGAK